MSELFYARIRPYVLDELLAARHCGEIGDFSTQFIHLESAHVLGQRSTRLHVLAHINMLRWAIAQRDVKEVLGQIVRIVGAATKTWAGLVPEGNTGGVNVSAFATLPINRKHAYLIKQASNR